MAAAGAPPGPQQGVVSSWVITHVIGSEMQETDAHEKTIVKLPPT